MDFKKYLDKTAEELDKEVEEILKEQLSKATKTDKKLNSLIKAFALACQGGKRIRGVLVKLGYELGKLTTDYRLPTTDYRGRRKTEDILRVGAAVEIVHTAILVHDDIIDESLTRREQASLYAALGGDHYGVSQAISLADYGFFLSYKIICETDFPCELKIKALNFFSQVMMNTGWGEILDLEDTDPLVVMKLKTAHYTISGPLALGAILGGLGPTSPRLRGIKYFGENLGIAFQIRDDILDAEIDRVGGIDNAKKEAEKYKIEALKILPNITKDEKMSTLLQQLAEYLIERNK